MKRRFLIMGFLLIIIFIVIVGAQSSFSIFKYESVGNIENKILTGTMDARIVDLNRDIVVDNTNSFSDFVYTFGVENLGSLPIKYNLVLKEDLARSSINISDINYILLKNGVVISSGNIDSTSLINGYLERDFLDNYTLKIYSQKQGVFYGTIELEYVVYSSSF